MTERRRVPLRALIALVAAVLGLVAGACSDDGPESRPGAEEPTGMDLGPDTPRPPELITRTPELALPVSFTASGAVFEVAKVELSNATPGTYLDDEPDLLDDELLYVSFSAVLDPASGSTEGIEWPVKSFQLVTAAGRVIAASGVNYETGVVAIANQATQAAVVFPADDDDLAGARFRLDDGVNPPGEVALMEATPTAPENPSDNGG